MNIAPFVPSGMTGNQVAMVADAKEQAAKTEGMRKKLYELQQVVGTLVQTECPLQHVFAPGAYARTIHIPAGTVIVGKIHKHAHLNILSQGAVRVVTEGEGTQELTGPLTMVSPPGTKRAVYAITDVVWTTIHLTSETNLEKIEAEVIAPNFADYERFALGNNMTNIGVTA